MDKSILEKMAAYIEATQPQLDKIAEQKEALRKQASDTSAVLVSRGVLDESKRDEFINRVVEDPSVALKMAEKLAAALETESYGKVATIKVGPADKVDPFVAAFCPEYVNQTVNL